MSGDEANTRSRRGNHWIGLGGVLGLLSSLAAIAVPFLLIEIARYAPGGIAQADSRLLGWGDFSLIVGAVLLFLSFYAYRKSFSILRGVDARWYSAWALCWVGSIGAIPLIVAAGLAAGNLGGLLGCLQGPYNQVYSCVQGQSPLGAYATLLGVWLAWLGGIGFVVGLALAGARFRSRLYLAAAVCYTVTLVLLVGPLVGIFRVVPYVQALLLPAAVFAVVGPLLALLAWPTYPKRAAAA